VSEQPTEQSEDLPETGQSESTESTNNEVEATAAKDDKPVTTDSTPDLQPEPENRSTARVTLNRPMLIRLSSGETIKVRLINLSSSGLAFEYPASAELGATFKILFQLESKKGVVNIQAEAVATHSHVKSESFVIGVEFTKISEEHADIIETFVENRHTSAAQLTGFAVSHPHG